MSRVQEDATAFSLRKPGAVQLDFRTERKRRGLRPLGKRLRRFTLSHSSGGRLDLQNYLYGLRGQVTISHEIWGFNSETRRSSSPLVTALSVSVLRRSALRPNHSQNDSARLDGMAPSSLQGRRSDILDVSPAIRKFRCSENGRLGEIPRTSNRVNSDVVDFVAARAQTFSKRQQPVPHGSNSLNPKQLFSTYFYKVRGMLWEQVSWST